MALSLSDLNTFRDKLIQARANGLRSVKDQNGEEIQYRSDGELSAALRDIESRIAAYSQAKPVKQIRFTSSKG